MSFPNQRRHKSYSHLVFDDDTFEFLCTKCGSESKERVPSQAMQDGNAESAARAFVEKHKHGFKMRLANGFEAV